MPTANIPLHQRLHALYCNHHGWLQAWLSKRLGCPHHAADVAQNTFLRILSGGHDLSEVQQPRAWLTTTAKRLIVDEARRRCIEQAYLAELAARTEDEDFSPSSEEIVAAVQAIAQLTAILEAASVKARTAFIRHYIDGMTQSDVAAELGVSVKMVQKYLVQVLLQVRNIGTS